jgi:Ca2+-binding RTX toxin-like protein/methionine-rich copper-binding protein CopC
VIDNMAFNTNDDLRTGVGDDTISSGQGSDNVDAGEGNDTVNVSGQGSDNVDAGEGNDTVNVVAVSRHSQSDVLDGGSGTDTLNLDYSAEWNYNNYSGYYNGGFDYGVYDAQNKVTTLNSGSTLNAIQTALGTAVKTVFDGQNTDVSVSNFEIINVKGSQTDNLLIYQSGSSYDGQSGTDTFYADWSKATAAITWMNDPTATSQPVNGVTISNVERLLLLTGSGDDKITNLKASTSDYLSTGAGNDTLDAGSGSDTMVGGLGNDFYVVDSSGDVVTELASEGVDTVQSTISYILGANLENLILAGVSAINGTGNATGNNIVGNSGNNTISGGEGSDTIYGGEGSDMAIFTGQFEDYVIDYNAGLSAYTVVDKIANRDGTDVISSVENFKFADGTKIVTSSILDVVAPTVLSLTPPDGIGGVAIGSDIVLVFSEAIKRGVGAIVIHSGSADGPVFESYDVAVSPNLAITGNMLTINPAVNLANSVHYFVTFAAGSVKDLAGNSYVGIDTYDFIAISPAISIAPSHSSVQEGNTGTTSVTFTVTLSAASSETATVNYATSSLTAQSNIDFAATSGTLTFSPGETAKSFDVSIIGDSSYENDEIFSLALSNPLGAILDLSGSGFNRYEAFVTIVNDELASSDTIAPTLTTCSPSNASTGMVIGRDIKMTFSEDIQKGTGMIVIHSDSATGAIVESYDVTTSVNLTVSGNMLSINPTDALVYGTHYFITLCEGIVKDLAGNSYTGNDSYDFTTVAAGHDLTGSVTFWKSGSAIAGVSTNIGSDGSTSATDGLFQHLDLADGSYALTSSKVSGTPESTAIKANDALAALKIAVGMNPNADGSAVSPYQYLAADVNHDGQIKSADALNILKMAVKLDTAPAKEWLFVPESIGSESMTRTHVVWPDNPIPVTLDMNQELNLIGIVKGDVNGSWVA